MECAEAYSKLQRMPVALEDYRHPLCWVSERKEKQLDAERIIQVLSSTERAKRLHKMSVLKERTLSLLGLHIAYASTRKIKNINALICVWFMTSI